MSKKKAPSKKPLSVKARRKDLTGVNLKALTGKITRLDRKLHDVVGFIRKYIVDLEIKLDAVDGSTQNRLDQLESAVGVLTQIAPAATPAPAQESE